MEPMIIAAYAGTGKTTLSRLCPETVVDFVCMPYKYVLDPISDGMDSESCKADPDNVMRDDWPLNYIEAIQAALEDQKLLLIPTDLHVLWLLRQEEIPYCLCYPQRSAKEIYRRRFMDRGNTEQFIDVFIGGWDGYITAFERDAYGKHIVLRDDQFLSDVLNAPWLA
jgi:hypothetical protein